VKLLFLPTHSSTLNPIETLWAHLKRRWRNILYRIQGALMPEDIPNLVGVMMKELGKQGQVMSTAAFRSMQ